MACANPQIRVVSVSEALSCHRHLFDDRGMHDDAAFWDFGNHEFIRARGNHFVPLKAGAFYGRVTHPRGELYLQDYGGISGLYFKNNRPAKIGWSTVRCTNQTKLVPSIDGTFCTLEKITIMDRPNRI